MGQLRTTNKRHKRAQILRQSLKKPVQTSDDAAVSPEEKA